MAQIDVNVDDEIKREAEEVLNEIGMPLSTAINVFLKTVARENRIPFEFSDELFYPNQTKRINER